MWIITILFLISKLKGFLILKLSQYSSSVRSHLQKKCHGDLECLQIMCHTITKELLLGHTTFKIVLGNISIISKLNVIWKNIEYPIMISWLSRYIAETWYDPKYCWLWKINHDSLTKHPLCIHCRKSLKLSQFAIPSQFLTHNCP